MRLILIVQAILLTGIASAAAIQPMQLSGTNQTALRILDPWLNEKPPSTEMNITGNMNTMLMRQPCIHDSRVKAGPNHIGVTIQSSITADAGSLNNVIALIMATYVEYVKSGYQGYLRIGLVDGLRRVSSVWEVTAWDALTHSQNSTIETAWIVDCLNNHTDLQYNYQQNENWLQG